MIVPRKCYLRFAVCSISRAKGNLNCLQVTTDTQADDEEKAQTVRIRQKTE